MSRQDVPTFVRGYARTWVHALAAAAMTALGTLTFVHRGFAALAIAAYLLPPIVLYLTGNGAPEAEAPADGPVRTESSAGVAGGEASTEGGHGERTDAGMTAEPAGADLDRADVEVDGRKDDVGGEGDEGGGDDEDGGGDTGAGTPDDWSAVDVPTEATLHDVALADGRAVAVGAGGVVVAGDDEWDVLLESGPGADANTLRGASETGDGGAVWFAGDGGALGRLDVGSGRHVDHSAPDGVTDTWTDVAVAGEAGEETVLLVNGSGEALRGRYRDGDVVWEDPITPGSGSSLSGATLATPEAGHLCDTNDGVFETTDGRSFRTVGVDADGTLTDVATAGEGDCLVSADDGVLHRYDGSNWTPLDLADGPLHAVSRAGGAAIACGDDALHGRSDSDGDWTRTFPPAAGDLRSVAIGQSRAVAVGERGTVVARDR
ncbi:hypothetical protein HUG10_16450 [Halorarum halophilum]|uniref:Uncharacterized protein n=1 Tax=Halorarum halophilum TaxID=2743090 RepID=A0A7D5GYW4_9EURY|nr:hypothetical protein [Halobaculum halophilum]QLG29029.1 hypothetical protein HUG10_16450 [Halobaculum halophilum]